MASSRYRVLILGDVSPSLAAARRAAGEYDWVEGDPPVDSMDDRHFDAVIFSGPPFPPGRAGIFLAGDVPVIAIIREPSAEVFQRAMDLGLADVLVEPFPPGELMYRLSKHISVSPPGARAAESHAGGQIESALRRTDEHLRLIMGSANDFGIFTTDLEGRVTFWSRGAEILFGFESAEMLGGSTEAIFTPEDLANGVLQKELKTALENGRSENERWHIRKSGERFWGSGFMMPLRDSGVRGFLKIVRDRTERKRFEQRLEEAVSERTAELRAVNEQLDSYASYVAHDLRSPVRVIRGLCEIIEERLTGKADEEEIALIHRILRSADKMNDFITKLLEYSRSVTVAAKLEPVALTAVVQDALRKHAMLIKTHGANIEVAPLLPKVIGSALLISQAVDNLVGNALKFHQKDRNPAIRIFSERRGDRVRLWIEDNGIGIDPQFHDRIFQPLQRLHTQDSYEGNGLGLSIVARAVERMNGEIGVESKLNVGSRFWIELVAAPDKTGRSHHQHATAEENRSAEGVGS